MSCRVLARGIETGLLAEVARLAVQGGANTLRARFIPTAKNTPAADCLPRHGFTDLGDTHWRLALDAAPAFPPHLEIVRE